MTKLTKSLLGLSVSGSISPGLTYLLRMRGQIVEKKPELKDPQTGEQLSWRHMFLKVVALWHALSAAEKLEWESVARPRHMTGYAWFVSQALRPNPGIYLPLQGGTMAGIIDMDGYAIQDLLDPAAAQDADTKAARDAAIAAAIGGSLTCDIYGWDGGFWQKILVESGANPNLRARLYDGANGIASRLGNTSTVPLTARGLLTGSFLYAWDGAILRRLEVESSTNPNLRVSIWKGGSVANITALDFDNVETTRFGLQTVSALVGFDGTAWDRLRTYPTGILKVGRAELPTTEVRKTAAGAVVAGARKVYWIACSPDAPAAEWQLTDAIAGGAAIKYDHFDNDKHSDHITFDPSMKFSTGIWIEKFDHMASLTFCYI